MHRRVGRDTTETYAQHSTARAVLQAPHRRAQAKIRHGEAPQSAHIRPRTHQRTRRLRRESGGFAELRETPRPRPRRGRGWWWSLSVCGARWGEKGAARERGVRAVETAALRGSPRWRGHAGRRAATAPPPPASAAARHCRRCHHIPHPCASCAGARRQSTRTSTRASAQRRTRRRGIAQLRPAAPSASLSARAAARTQPSQQRSHRRNRPRWRAAHSARRSPPARPALHRPTALLMHLCRPSGLRLTPAHCAGCISRSRRWSARQPFPDGV
ncbi:hypothetical protein JIQ42_07889 [Leishmania sp. Namibia]|uniref:hypothetical protein n=1 Tax=Leishmania sp. Namibia TaxID=2802991 RepID=UPI001B5F0680|nr:hypothetical protein JIQ42_07889 [Leishmania sp. Namibia]